MFWSEFDSCWLFYAKKIGDESLNKICKEVPYSQYIENYFKTNHKAAYEGEEIWFEKWLKRSTQNGLV